jgi:ATP-dependent Clp protease ATP-binding subunit ClpC
VKDTDLLDRFAEQTRQVLHFAREEALRFQHSYIGSEHLLLGLIREDHDIAAKVLKSLGADLPGARNSIYILIGRGVHAVDGEIVLSQRSRELLQIAGEEARCLGHDSIGTAHLLLALVHEDQGIVASILGSLGIQPEVIRTKTLQALNK